jgi:hypothetical protein
MPVAEGTALGNRIMQLEMIGKQKDTKISSLERELVALTNALEKSQELVAKLSKAPATAPAPSGKSAAEVLGDTKPAPAKKKDKRKAPTRTCGVCGAEVYTMWHKRHEAVCTVEAPSTKGVKKNA